MEFDPNLAAQGPREWCGRAGSPAYQVDPGPDAGAARQITTFPAVEEYQRWVREVIDREHNALDWAPSWSRNDAPSAPAAANRRCRYTRRSQCQGAPLEHDPGGQAELFGSGAG